MSLALIIENGLNRMVELENNLNTGGKNSKYRNKTGMTSRRSAKERDKRNRRERSHNAKPA